MGFELDYDQLIFLDAEDLAEHGIGRAYQSLLPKLQQYVAHPAEIEEISDTNRYAVKVRDRVYVIYSPEVEDDSWPRATHAFFTIVNDQLIHSQHRLYAINGGNDLAGMFLTAAEAEAAREGLPRKTDWPYLPTAEGPWYGQSHN